MRSRLAFVVSVAVAVVRATVAGADISEHVCWDRNYPDPTLWKGADGKFYAYATPGSQMDSLPYLVSDDGIDWKSFGRGPFSKDTAAAIRKDWKWIWAPDRVTVAGTNLLYVSLVNPEDPDKPGGNTAIGVFRLRGGEPGEACDLKIITAAKDTGIVDTIDPEVVTDPETGKVWLFFGSTGKMHRVELTPDGLSVKPGAKYVHVAGRPVTENKSRSKVFEGAYLLRHDRWWYLFVSGGWYAGGSYCLRVGRSRTLEGKFLNREGHPMTAGSGTLVLGSEGDFFGPGHNGDVLKGSDGVERMYYHSHWKALGEEKKNMRVLLARRLKWDDEGWPYLTVDDPSFVPPKSFADTTSWDPYVSNITDTVTYLRRKFRQDVTDPSTGLDMTELRGRMWEIRAAGKRKGEDWRVTKAKMFSALCLKQAIDVSPYDFFPAIGCWKPTVTYPVIGARAGEIRRTRIPEAAKRADRGYVEGSFGVTFDYGHSVPEWHNVLPLGFPGLKARLAKYHRPDDAYSESLRIAMDSILKQIDRFVRLGERNLKRTKDPEGTRRLKAQVASLRRLRSGPPQTAYDVMMFMWLVFFDGEYLDRISVRSFGQIDLLLTPYYEADVAAGRTTEAEFREHFRHFLWQWGSIASYWNQPIGLGGTKADGTSEYNHVTKIILDVIDECYLPTPKFLVKVAPNTPDWAWDKLLDMAIRHRSLVFCGEEGMTRILKAKGYSDEKCRTAVMKGCYEFEAREATNQSIPGAYSLLYPVRTILDDAATNGLEAATFADFRAEYDRRLKALVGEVIKTSFAFEQHLEDVNPSLVFTLCTEHALKNHVDAWARGCDGGNDSAYMMTALGSAVDAIMSVKELVYERKELSLKALGELMAADWQGREDLRRRMLRAKRKWGNNDAEANEIGASICRLAGAAFRGVPNARGGKYMNSGHSSRAFIWAGNHLGATPDGRKSGEEVSKNLSAVQGADTEGTTALVQTLSSIDGLDVPGDFPLDVMMHPSSVHGRKGLDTMRAVVAAYHANGGCALHFNVFDAKELRDAQAHPEKYETLQVRVCGWNIRWNDMSKVEQDKYILRAESIQR